MEETEMEKAVHNKNKTSADSLQHFLPSPHGNIRQALRVTWLQRKKAFSKPNQHIIAAIVLIRQAADTNRAPKTTCLCSCSDCRHYRNHSEISAVSHVMVADAGMLSQAIAICDDYNWSSSSVFFNNLDLC